MSLEREVALKVLHPDLSTNPEVAERFRTEAQLAAQLDHSNIVSIYGIGSRAGLLWYTMEYIPGQNLAQVIDIEGPMELDRWVTIMNQALRALEHAHAQELVHRDLKPENILIDGRDGSVQITDFGLALALHEERARSRDSHSGTPEYAAPEQMLGETVDYRADLYALSVVGISALTGHAPFPDTSVRAVLARKIAGDLPDLRRLRPDIPDAIVTVLERGAAKNPEERFESATAFREALRAASGSWTGAFRTRLRGFFGAQ